MHSGAVHAYQCPEGICPVGNDRQYEDQRTDDHEVLEVPAACQTNVVLYRAVTWVVDGSTRQKGGGGSSCDECVKYSIAETVGKARSSKHTRR